MQANMWKEIKKITEESELQKMLFGLRIQLKDAYKQKFNGKLKDTSTLKKLKKNIARVLMQLNNIKKAKHA